MRPSRTRIELVIMDRPRRFWWLRFAASAAFVMLCLLIAASWVRSYWAYDTLTLVQPKTPVYYGVGAAQGVLMFVLPTDKTLLAKFREWQWQLNTLTFQSIALPTKFGFAFFRDSTEVDLAVPHWFALLLSAALAALPWLRFRFSLRTMLIVTTLIALLLAIAAWFRLW